MLKIFLRPQINIVRNKLDCMSTDILSTDILSTDILSTVILSSRFSLVIFLHSFYLAFLATGISSIIIAYTVGP